VTARDRTVLIVVGMLAVLGGFWFLAISPKRKQANDVATQIGAAQTRLDAAQASASAATAAKARYSSDYATVARLGKAVPVDDEMPSLVYQLEQNAKSNKIDFNAIKLTGTASGASAPTGAAAAVASATGNTGATGSVSTISAALPPGASVGTAGFPTMPFSFDFTGTYFNLQRFLKSLDGLTTVGKDSINVKGRLLTVDGVGIKAGPKGFPQIEATVVATAYLLPSDEGLTAGATPTSPTTGAPSAAGTTATASLIGSN
jgi:type II secretory pathway pseudopilin PulG